MAYSVILLILSVALFWDGKNKEKIVFKALFKSHTFNGTVFFIIFLFSVVLMFFIGTYPAIAFLTVFELLMQKKMKVGGVLIFTACLLCTVYIVFSVMLKIPMEKGILLY